LVYKSQNYNSSNLT